MEKYSCQPFSLKYSPPEQYDTDVRVRPGSRESVEFAVKIPSEGGFLYLPVDSKFPGDTYGNLKDAYESGSPEEIGRCAKILVNTIRSEAEIDSRQIYLSPLYYGICHHVSPF